MTKDKQIKELKKELQELKADKKSMTLELELNGDYLIQCQTELAVYKGTLARIECYRNRLTSGYIAADLREALNAHSVLCAKVKK